ncbi:MAG: hypothetical protein ACOH2B_00680 [Burkholderiaceae bacterium]
MTRPTRTKHDLLGAMELPADNWFGIHAHHAVDSCAITGVPISHFPAFVKARSMLAPRAVP